MNDDTFLLELRDAYFALTREFASFGIEIIGNPDGFQVCYDKATCGEKHQRLAEASLEAMDSYIERLNQYRRINDER